MRRKISLLLLVTAAFACLVAGCGGGDSSDEDSGRPATTADLDGKSFVATGATGHELVADSPVTFTFKGGSLNIGTECNGASGKFEVKDGVLTMPLARSTLMGCPSELMAQDKWLTDLLETGAETELSGDDLTLTGEGETTLVLTSS